MRSEIDVSAHTHTCMHASTCTHMQAHAHTCTHTASGLGAGRHCRHVTAHYGVQERGLSRVGSTDDGDRDGFLAGDGWKCG